MNVPNDVFDKIDGKSVIYIIKPDKQRVGDLLIPSETIDYNIEFIERKFYRCIRDNDSFDDGAWVEINENYESGLYNFLNGKYSDNSAIDDIYEQSDKKVDIWSQDDMINDFDWSDKPLSDGDMWYSKQNSAMRGQLVTYSGGDIPITGTSFGNYDYLYDEVDGHISLYVTQPESQNAKDIYIPYETSSFGHKFIKKKVYRCIADSDVFNPNDWIEVDYTDDTKANEAYGLAETAKDLGDKLVTALGFQTTEVTDKYILTPVLGTGYLLVGDEEGVYAKIDGATGKLSCRGADIEGNVNITSGQLSISDTIKGTSVVIGTDGKLTCTGADITGKITATEGEFHGTIGVGAATNTDGSNGYNFVVDKDGNVFMNGGITLGGTITWSTPPIKYQYSSNNRTWHDTYEDGDIYRREKLGNDSWGEGYQFIGVDGENGVNAELPGYITDTYIDFESVNAPYLRGNNISMYGGRFKVFNVNKSQFDTDITANTTCVGFMGYGTGHDGKKTTEGVVLSSGEPDSLGNGDYYLIVTDSGIRMQAGDYSIYVTASGCYQSVYDREAMKEYPSPIGVCVFG